MKKKINEQFIVMLRTYRLNTTSKGYVYSYVIRILDES